MRIVAPLLVAITEIGKGRDFMSYVIIAETSWGMEYRTDIRGSRSLEKFTDSRILRLYATAKIIYKLYENSKVEVLKNEEMAE